MVILERETGGRNGHPGRRRWRAAWASGKVELEGGVTIQKDGAGWRCGCPGRRSGHPGKRSWRAAWSSGKAELEGSVVVQVGGVVI